MKRSHIAGICVVSIVTALVVWFPRAAAADHSEKWTKTMRGLYSTLSNLLTDVTSDQRFRDPANKKRIQSEADQLAKLAHDLKAQKADAPDHDPTVQIVAELIADETKYAANELRRDNRGYARDILRSIPGYCIACHTRNETGPQLGKLPMEPSSEGLTSLERGLFFTASRQFNRAQEEFKKIVDCKNCAIDSFDWEKAVQESLVIAVRVKHDPDQALSVVNSILTQPSAPSFIKDDAAKWKTSIEVWKTELKNEPKTEEGLYSEAVRLMAKAHDRQKYPMDRSADIDYLRASATLHDLLQVAPNGSHVAEAFFLAGICYEVLSPLQLEDLHNIYYQACIQKSPHTTISDLCFRRYEQGVYLGYTGSAGTDVPSNLRDRLAKLRTLASPQLKLKE